MEVYFTSFSSLEIIYQKLVVKSNYHSIYDFQLKFLLYKMHTDKLLSGHNCFNRMAVAKPAGPAPTIATSNSILYLGGSVLSDIFFPTLIKNFNIKL